MLILPAKTGAPALDAGKSADLAKLADEQERFYRDALLDIWTSAVRYWKLYLAKRPDPRKEHEKWRANVFLPYPFLTAETIVAQLVDIITGSIPYIQAGGVGDEDYAGARSIERLLDYTLNANSWRRLLTTSARATTIQGTDFLKSVWTRRTFTYYQEVNEADALDFDKYLQEEVVAKFQIAPPPDWRTDPQSFAEWRDIVNKDGRARVPSPPVMSAGPQEIVQYEGPLIQRVPFWDVRMDPQIQDMGDQHCIIQRMVKPLEWLEARTGDEPDKPYSPLRVSEGMAGWDGQRISEYEREVAEAIGIGVVSDTQNPYYKDGVEILEKWAPGTQYPFQVVLNRKTVINKYPDRTPYLHGRPTLLPVRKLVVPGYSYGMSTLMQGESLFYEGNSLRNLRLDGVTLAVLPIFTRLREVGLPELQRKLTPASIIEVNRADAIKQLITSGIAPDAWREMPEIKGDIDDAEATGQNVRGATSSVNRVSATESSGRLNQALLRSKLAAVSVEEDLSEGVPQWLALWAQFAPPVLRVQVGGKPDAVLQIGKAALLEALNADYRFRGATRAVNRDLTVQNLMTLTEKFKDVMHPSEVRAAMKVIAETMSIPQVSRIVNDEVTAKIVVAFEQAQAQQAAQAAQQQKTNAAAAATAGAPTAIPQGQAQAIEQGAGSPGGGGNGAAQAGQ